ncbi:MAG: EamA family transporter [Nitrospirae bacterium]|nr:MAG: EamA family transporter [Nitrospirota bacterium]
MPSIPVFAAAAAVLLGVERPTWRRAAGIALAVAGALVMLGPAGLELGAASTLGNLLVLLNCLSYSLFLVLQRPLLERLGALTVIAWSFLFGGAGVALVAAPWLARLEPAAWGSPLWAGLAYIALVPTALNYALNTWAVSRSTPSLVAAYTTLQPLAAATLAALFLGERPGWPHLAGGALIAAGLALVSRAQDGGAPARG